LTHALTTELAPRGVLRVGIEWMRYRDAGMLSAGARGNPAEDAWDVAFMGAEPARASVIDFTAAYVEIEATYLVPAGSPIESIADVGRLRSTALPGFR